MSAGALVAIFKLLEVLALVLPYRLSIDSMQAGTILVSR